jgi:hypothetical protein
LTVAADGLVLRATASDFGRKDAACQDAASDRDAASVKFARRHDGLALDVTSHRLQQVRKRPSRVPRGANVALGAVGVLLDVVAVSAFAALLRDPA